MDNNHPLKHIELMEKESPFSHFKDVTYEVGINNLINGLKEQSPVDTNLISDGYHTFGELYEHRIALYMALCRTLNENYTYDEIPVWLSKIQSDGSMMDGWFLLGIHTEPGLQITYHLPDKYWSDCTFFARRLSQAPAYDGHTPEDVIERLKTIE